MLAAVAWIVLWLVAKVWVVAVALAIALFPAALLSTPVRMLKERRWPPLLATWSVIVAGVLVFVGLGFIIGPQIAHGIDPIVSDFDHAVGEVQTWLTDGPLGLSRTQIADAGDAIVSQLQSALAGSGGIIGNAGRAVEFVTGVFLTLVITFFLLKDGDAVFSGVLRRLSPERRDRVRRAGLRAWETLGGYIRGIAVVGLVDASLIGIGLLLVGVPLAFPLALFVFFGAFFPLIGAFVSGLLAVAVAFANGGAADALVVLAIITAVQQLEGHVVLPVVFGHAMRLHPLLVLLAVASGGLAFGIIGAFLAVPLLAVVLAIREELAEHPEDTFIPVVRGDFADERD